MPEEAGATKAENEQEYLEELSKKPFLSRLGGYVKLSGPGWLQSAITLGGGSLAGALYLGVLGGASLLFVQLFAMIIGVIMLSAIGYVALSTKQRPFQAINEHINPVLGWGWAIATLMANMVWCLPQFSLGTAAIRQNLLPGLFGAGAGMPDWADKLIVVALILAAAVVVIWTYDKGSKGVKLFEGLLKVMVGIIVVSFFLVVVRLAFSEKGLEWGGMFSGFLPNVGRLGRPADALQALLQKVDPGMREFWSGMIVDTQRDVAITAAATAVGINMTFLLPYSMLARGWGKAHRGLARVDLGMGLLIPYVLATTCVVMAASSQFHGKPGVDLETGTAIEGSKLPGRYTGLLLRRVKHEMGDEAYNRLSEAERNERANSLGDADKMMAAVLVKRDTIDLAGSLEPLTGRAVGNYIFGIGVLGMALSTIIILMLISGFVVCEMIGIPPKGKARRYGSLVAAVGLLGPFIWGGKTAAWLAIPTSVFNFTLLPIAYIAFVLLLNQKRILGDEMPAGGSRIRWNVLTITCTLIATVLALWAMWIKIGWYTIVAVGVFLVLVVVGHFLRKPKSARA